MQKTAKHKSSYYGCIGKNHLNCFVFVLAVIFFLSGCSTLISLNPVGANPLQIQKDDWEGVWWGGDEEEKREVYFIWVKDKDNGILRIGVVGVDKEKKDLTLMKFDVQLRQGKSSVFGNILFKEFSLEYEKGDKTKEVLENSYLWFTIKNVDNIIIIDLPDAKAFKELVIEGKLKGEETILGSYSSNIFICEPTDKITEFIDSYDDRGKLFVTSTLRRISKALQFF